MEDVRTQGLKIMRRLSRWQLSILTVADRDTVLCSDGARGDKTVAAAGGRAHVLAGGVDGGYVPGGVCPRIVNTVRAEVCFEPKAEVLSFYCSQIQP
ncbi:hypothetical protein [Roseovarius aestuariivivens]|uniref:hypothetical protein n=1 Tax=Roseovarius aestuariivivens TaxID=1888910 RepID=UPI0010804B74|nr:hypothetical protein [Roseovarius aestuariivivens]